MGTVTNHAMKMFRKRRQSTAFLERSQPTETTDPTCPTSKGTAQHQSRHLHLPKMHSFTPQPRALGPVPAYGDLTEHRQGVQDKELPPQRGGSTWVPMVSWQSLGGHERGFVFPSSPKCPRDPPHGWAAAATSH